MWLFNSLSHFKVRPVVAFLVYFSMSWCYLVAGGPVEAGCGGAGVVPLGAVRPHVARRARAGEGVDEVHAGAVIEAGRRGHQALVDIWASQLVLECDNILNFLTLSQHRLKASPVWHFSPEYPGRQSQEKELMPSTQVPLLAHLDPPSIRHSSMLMSQSLPSQPWSQVHL